MTKPNVMNATATPSVEATTPQRTHAADVPARAGRIGRLLRRPEFGALAGALLVYAFFAVFAGPFGFLSVQGTAAWLNTAAELGIIALAAAMLMIAGEFDLSVGSMLGASSMIVAIATSYGVPPWLAIAAALAAGALVGLVNGIVVVRTGLPSFIVTLAMLFVLAGTTLGVSRLVTGVTQVQAGELGSAHQVFGSQWLGFSVSIVWWLALAAVTAWILVGSVFGNWIYSTGGDVTAARKSGVNTNRVKISLFVTTGVAAALVGVIQTVNVGSGDVLRGQLFEFKVIIAVVIGGVLLTGGYGSAIGAILGAMTFGIVQLGIFYTGWNTDWFQVFLGILLAVAVLANNLLRKKAMKTR